MQKFTELHQIDNLGARETKKHLGEILGHKVDEIVMRMYYNGHLMIRFRHQTYAYSHMHIFKEKDGLVYKMENFETRELQEIKQSK